ncbi:MAG: aldo/keto reductase, partial [Saprospiraceae bacterium]|nr:aldo/keto reductase [Saprospiraceae bacterium]
RWVEDGLLDELERQGMGAIAFSPLEQGILTNKYLSGIPSDSRVARDGRYLKSDQLDEATLNKVRMLNDIATNRGQSLAQMAIAWLLKDNRITSVLVGVSRISQLEDNLKVLDNLSFSEDELKAIEEILKS